MFEIDIEIKKRPFELFENEIEREKIFIKNLSHSKLKLKGKNTLCQGLLGAKPTPLGLCIDTTEG